MDNTEKKEVALYEELGLQIETNFNKFKEEQETRLKENPLVIVNNKDSYKEAKANWQNLRNGRLEVQRQDKAITDNLNKLKKNTKGAAEELIKITKETEDSLKAELDKWDAEEAERKAEEARKEEELKLKIVDSIETFRTNATDFISAIRLEDQDHGRAILQRHIAIQKTRKHYYKEYYFTLLETAAHLETLFKEREEKIQRDEELKLINQQNEVLKRIEASFSEWAICINELEFDSINAVKNDFEEYYKEEQTKDYGIHTEANKTRLETLKMSLYGKIAIITQEKQKEERAIEFFKTIDKETEIINNKINSMTYKSIEEVEKYIIDKIDNFYRNPIFTEVKDNVEEVIITIKVRLESTSEKLQKEYEYQQKREERLKVLKPEIEKSLSYLQECVYIDTEERPKLKEEDLKGILDNFEATFNQLYEQTKNNILNYA